MTVTFDTAKGNKTRTSSGLVEAIITFSCYIPQTPVYSFITVGVQWPCQREQETATTESGLIQRMVLETLEGSKL